MTDFQAWGRERSRTSLGHQGREQVAEKRVAGWGSGAPHSTPTGAVVLLDSHTKPKSRDEFIENSKLTPSV